MRKSTAFFIAIIVAGIIFITFKGYFERKLTFFSVPCPQKYQNPKSDYIRDPMSHTVIMHSKSKGISAAKDEAQLKNRKLKQVNSSKYIVDRLTHSYPYLTENSCELLEQIADSFHKKIKGSELEGAKFYVTSLTRTEESVKRLMKNNVNAVTNSTHLHGNAFDISYSRFSLSYHRLKPCHTDYLREVLAEVILEMKAKNKCWALKEYHEKCFHIVCAF